MRSRNLENSKQPQALTLNDAQRQTLHGSLLGDACLEWSSKSRNPRIKFEQSAEHRDYLFHLFDVFKDFVTGEPKQRIRKCSTGVDCIIYGFQTISHGCFRFYARQYVVEGKKSVPKLIHRWITPRSFAYWFMDDGSCKSRESKGVLLNTHGFSPVDVQRLAGAVNERLGLATSLRKQREGLQIYISGKSYERLVELLDPSIRGTKWVTACVHLAVCWNLRWPMSRLG